jgi:hypothetical protein
VSKLKRIAFFDWSSFPKRTDFGQDVSKSRKKEENLESSV